MEKIKLEELKLLDAYFRASNYLAAGQLYLLDNPLLRRKLTLMNLLQNLIDILELTAHKQLYLLQ